MKKVALILFLSVFTLSLSSCQNKNKGKNTESQQTETTILSVDDLLDKAESLTDQTVTVEGVCTHICKHGGKKIFLMGSDDTKTIRVESNDKIGAFSQECVNSMVTVTGKLVEKRIDEAYLTNWEAEVKAKTDEKHGDGEGAGCSSEQKAQNEAPANTVETRIENFRKRIAEEKAKTGKEYLSFYHIEADSYKIQ